MWLINKKKKQLQLFEIFLILESNKYLEIILFRDNDLIKIIIYKRM